MTLDYQAMGRLEDGAEVDRYRVRRWLGRGHCGDVYEALHTGTTRTVALKLAATAEGAAALQRETEILALLEHPAIVPLLDAGRWHDRAYLALGFARGGTLERRAGAPWPLDAALRVLGPVAEALDAVHALGIVHRDVCARNVLLDGAGRPWLADFSVALRPGETLTSGSGENDPHPPTPSPNSGRGGATASFTHAEDSDVIVTGTPEHIAPELVRGASPSPASDVYAFGVLAYLLLTGTYPVRGDGFEDTVMRQRDAVIRPPSTVNPLLPPAVDAALLRALARDPAERFASAAAFVSALRPATAGAAPAPNLPEKPAGGDVMETMRAGERLEQFVRTLPPAEQAAVILLLRQREAELGRASVALQTITSHAFGPAAALLALEDTGAAALLAAAPATPVDLARAGAGYETPLRLLLDYLAHRGLLARTGDRYALLPELALLYAPARGRQHPVRDAWVFWSHLPGRVAGGGPAHTMDTDDGAVYEGTVATLADLALAAADEAAEALDIGGRRRGLRVLDVGAGSGIWSRAMAQRDPTLRVTALDRPRVLDVTRRHAMEAGTAERLTCLAGDMHTAELPRGAFDLVVLANVLHLEPGERIVPLLARLREALAPGGELAIVDITPERMAEATADQHLLGLHLALRTPAGKLHDAEEYRDWLAQAGFRPTENIVLTKGTDGLRLLLATPA
jgi:2-polyprenyl-3-methyl-5-hydroxy-6-metoxy-1,4-benzoquinol methylase/predicted Ser/Thr protein kinase